MELYELIAPCHFGLEAVMKREILDLGYEIERVEDGKVTFLADAEGIAYANLFLRTTERILLKVGQSTPRRTMNSLKRQKRSRGRNLSRKTESSG